MVVKATEILGQAGAAAGGGPQGGTCGNRADPVALSGWWGPAPIKTP